MIPKMSYEQILHFYSGKEVRVYFNLHKKCWSVKDKETNRVLCHTYIIELRDAKPKISERGRLRVIREKRKNVHAYVTGIIGEAPDSESMRRITYNPYKYDSFVFAEDESKWEQSKYARLVGSIVTVSA